MGEKDCLSNASRCYLCKYNSRHSKAFSTSVRLPLPFLYSSGFKDRFGSGHRPNIDYSLSVVQARYPNRFSYMHIYHHPKLKSDLFFHFNSSHLWRLNNKVKEKIASFCNFSADFRLKKERIFSESPSLNLLYTIY